MPGFLQSDQPEVVYLLGFFPALSETYILQEILELERQKMPLRIFSLLKPSDAKVPEGVWTGQAPVTYVSHQSRLNLLAIAFRRFFKTPRRFLYTTLLTVAHHRPRSAILCLLYGIFVSEQIEHQGIRHVHAHFAAESTAVAQVVYMLTTIPYSFTAHAYDIYLSRKSTLAYKMSMARFVVTVSAYNKRYLEKLVDGRLGGHIHCIYCGLNLALFPSDVSNVPTSSEVPLILAVCRLVEKKGLPYLLSACRMLKDQGYDYTCRIVGGGPQHRVLEQTIHQLGLSDNVELLGATPYRQVIEMYQRATMVALPCIIASNGDREGLPIALVEALYMGVPVVSTRVAGIPELISEEVNGLLIPPQDSSALAAALARLLDDPLLRRRLARAGREIVLERFDISKNVKRLRELFCAE